jgi:hypothetical protein
MSPAFACRDADAQGTTGPRPEWVGRIMLQKLKESPCREIKAEEDRSGANRVGEETVLVREGEREAPWLVLFVSAHSAARRRLTSEGYPAVDRYAGSAVPF